MTRWKCGTVTVRSQPNMHGRVTYLAAGGIVLIPGRRRRTLRKEIGKVAEEKKLTRMSTLTLWIAKG